MPALSDGGARAARPEVGLHVALEAPLRAQDVGQRVPVLGRVHTPHPVVGAHDRRDLGVLDQHLERQQVQLPQHVLVHLDVGPEPLVLLVVDHVVLAHGDHVVRLDGLGHRDAHHAGQVRVFGEVLEVAAGDRGAMQAHAGALQDVLAQRRRLRADDVAVGVRQVGVEAGGEADGHRQGRGGRARGAVAHADAHRAVGDPEARDAQLLDRRHVPLDLDLGGELVDVLLGLRGLRGDGVDVDRLHGAVQLSDLLLQRHGRDRLSARSRGDRDVSCQADVVSDKAGLL